MGTSTSNKEKGLVSILYVHCTCTSMSILADTSGGAGGLQRCSTAVVTRGLIIHAGDTQGHCSRISSKLGHCSSLCKYFLHAVDIKYFLVTISLVLTTSQTCIQTMLQDTPKVLQCAVSAITPLQGS